MLHFAFEIVAGAPPLQSLLNRATSRPGRARDRHDYTRIVNRPLIRSERRDGDQARPFPRDDEFPVSAAAQGLDSWRKNFRCRRRAALIESSCSRVERGEGRPSVKHSTQSERSHGERRRRRRAPSGISWTWLSQPIGRANERDGIRASQRYVEGLRVERYVIPDGFNESVQINAKRRRHFDRCVAGQELEQTKHVIAVLFDVAAIDLFARVLARRQIEKAFALNGISSVSSRTVTPSISRRAAHNASW